MTDVPPDGHFRQRRTVDPDTSVAMVKCRIIFCDVPVSISLGGSMRIPAGNDRMRDSRYFLAAEDAGRLADEAIPLLDRAVGVDWYEYGCEIDRAALALCRLRRAKAGEKGHPTSGDEAVRTVLEQASEPALVWLASRAISYMDESGFPEAVEAWFPDDV
jgi:hypothetical protein